MIFGCKYIKLYVHKWYIALNYMYWYFCDKLITLLDTLSDIMTIVASIFGNEHIIAISLNCVFKACSGKSASSTNHRYCILTMQLTLSRPNQTVKHLAVISWLWLGREMAKEEQLFLINPSEHNFIRFLQREITLDLSMLTIASMLSEVSTLNLIFFFIYSSIIL